ncbi:MAG: SgcQ protein [Anaerolineales bacterium]|nr:MAG: SgcQ protein [Anaerolineales bacterium]
MGFLHKLFAVDKPVIAMAHVPALPGTPKYDNELGIEGLINWVRKDIENLIQGGVDAIMLCNEDDRPYVLKADIGQVAAMTRVATEVKPKSIPFGIDFLWDPFAAIAIAHATGASFIREVITGTYESDMGIWAPNAGEVMRYRRQIGAENVYVFNNIVPEFASSLGTRSLALRAKSAVVSSLADAILISGPMAGDVPNLQAVTELKKATNGVPVFLNTGANSKNIASYLEVADGVIVGSSLKVDGYTWNAIDLSRVKEFMAIVNQVRMQKEEIKPQQLYESTQIKT